MVRGEQILAIEHTAIKQRNDPSAHAEVLAIRAAAAHLGSPYLPDCYLYTKLEPCPMCTSLAIWAKMRGVIYGANQTDAIAAYQRTGQWRQIPLRCREVIRLGIPALELHEDFCREACLPLFALLPTKRV